MLSAPRQPTDLDKQHLLRKASRVKEGWPAPNRKTATVSQRHVTVYHNKCFCCKLALMRWHSTSCCVSFKELMQDITLKTNETKNREIKGFDWLRFSEYSRQTCLYLPREQSKGHNKSLLLKSICCVSSCAEPSAVTLLHRCSLVWLHGASAKEVCWGLKDPQRLNKSTLHPSGYKCVDQHWDLNDYFL